MSEQTPTTEPAVQENTNTASPAVEVPAEETQATDENLALGDTPTEEEAAEETTEPAGAPEVYEAFNVPEEGYTVSEEQHAAFSEVAKSLNLTQEQAQTLIDLDAKTKIAAAQQEKEAIKATQEQNIAENKKTHGDKYPETIATAKKIYDSDLMPQGLRDTFKAAGFENNPDWLQFVANLGAKISEDVFVSGGKKVSGTEKKDRTLAQALSP
jgi:hypothetical protein